MSGTSSSSHTPYIQWDNSTSAKSIRVKIDFSWVVNGVEKKDNVTSIMSNSTDSSQPITVKYISTPTPLNIGGSTYSNGNTHQLPCGTSPITLSVPTATTQEPVGAAVEYLWSYPSGWTGPSVTSTNSVSVTPHINSEGTIRVRTKRTTDNFYTSITVNVNRSTANNPTLTGSALANLLFCNGSETVSVSTTSTNADRLIWTPTGGARINGSASAQTLPIGPVNVSSTGSGLGTYSVKAYSSTCQKTSSTEKKADVAYGPMPPPLEFHYTDSASTGGYVYSTNYAIGPTQINVSSWQNMALYQTGYVYWAASPNVGWSSGLGGYGNQYTVEMNPGVSFTINPTVTNRCGTTTTTSKTFTYPSSLRLAYPNPVQDELTLEFAEKSTIESLPEKILVFAETSTNPILKIDPSKEIKSANSESKIKVNMKKYPNGVYYLHTFRKGAKSPDIRRIVKE